MAEKLKSIFEFLRNWKISKNSKILYKKINDVIKKPIRCLIKKEVITIDDEKILYKAAEVMIKENKGTLVVLKHKKPIGLISEMDFLKIDFNKKSLKQKVKEVIEQKMVFVSPDNSILDAYQKMSENNLRKLVVLEEDKLVGIVTQTDILTELDAFASKTIIDVGIPGLIMHAMNKDMISIQKWESVSKAWDIMKTRKSDFIFIMEDDRPAGIITTNDIIGQMFLNIERLNKSTVETIMSTPLANISPNITIFEANKIMLMLEKKFNRLPVMMGNKMIGIVTQTDIIDGIFSIIDEIISNIESKGIFNIEHTKEK
ncbi:MAG: CBS domain-containing protein [Nanoarchaeota archaeon]|nr:CBS domain-containing protein [Nanoarchaeota archaeon]